LRAFESLAAPLLIGLVSDTHIFSARRAIPNTVLDALSQCDCIFHAGDVCVRRVLDQLEEIAPVRAVFGNNDLPELVDTLPRERVFTVGGQRIGLLHGHDPKRPARVIALERMRGRVDCVVYGHSHRPEIEERDGLLMVNPGSPTDPRYGRTPTYGLMQVGTSIESRIIALS
jgi:putative phosphoesterase